jgi:hypothetical protein
MIRALATGLIVLSIFSLPWGFTAVAVVVAMWSFNLYFEAIALALFFDLTFGFALLPLPFAATVAAVIGVVIVSLIKATTRVMS